MNIKSLISTNDEREIILFDTDSDNVCVDYCVTEVLTGFKKYFMPGSSNGIDERSSGTTKGATMIIGEGVVADRTKDDDGETFTSCAKMACPPLIKHRLMAPQWLGMQE